jgi:hypothetical protein
MSCAVLFSLPYVPVGVAGSMFGRLEVKSTQLVIQLPRTSPMQWDKLTSARTEHVESAGGFMTSTQGRMWNCGDIRER